MNELYCRRCRSAFFVRIEGLRVLVCEEVKTNYKPTKSAIDNALRSCNGQAKNLIINIQSDITDATLIDGVKSRIHRTDIETIVIVKNGKIVRTIKRKDILK